MFWNKGTRKIEPTSRPVEINKDQIKSEAPKADHLKEYLDFYRTIEQPRFGVLVTGEWGTGKTFQVQAAIPEDQLVYVSLYGIGTTEALHAETFAAAFPVESKLQQATKEVADAATRARGAFSIAAFAPLLVGPIIKRKIPPGKVLVFDDLERSEIATKLALGAINFYIEQAQLHVVVIAHDRKLYEAFRDEKEKLFGQTIEVAPKIDMAIDSFLSRHKSKTSSDFIVKNIDTVREVFLESGIQSLRVLRQVFDDLARLCDALEARHFRNTEAIRELVGFFSAFAFAIRSGQLGREDIHARNNSMLNYQMNLALKKQENHPLPPIVMVNKKFTHVDLEDKLLSDEVLDAIFIQGRMPATEVRKCLDQSRYFVNERESPPWLRVINFDTLEDVEVTQALEDMQRELEELAVTERGDILQTFALKLMMADNKIIDQSPAEVVKEAVNYIDQLTAHDKITIKPPLIDWRKSIDSGYKGHGFWILESTKDAFDLIRDKLYESHERVFKNRFPKIQEELIDLAIRDVEKFYNEVSLTSSGQSTYYRIPILASADPGIFVDSWLRMPRANWRKMTLALENRYSGKYLDEELADEEGFVRGVIDAISDRSAKLSGLSSLRLKRLIPRLRLR